MKSVLRKLTAATVFLSLSLAANAVPAKRGMWRVVTLADGSKARVELRGDEFFSYWADAKGRAFRRDSASGVYLELSPKEMDGAVMARRAEANKARAARRQAPRRVTIGGANNGYTGTKKALIILVQFTDTKFTVGHNKAFYNRVANEVGFTNSLGFKGSVKDYFLAQSNNQFNLDFDIAGPYTLRHEVAYYGAHSGSSNDSRPGAMVAEAVANADKDVDFRNYDWDGDGYVDQVFVLFAGLGEAAGGDENTIWPHEYNLASSDYGHSYPTEDNVVVNTYACGPEMTMAYTPLGYRKRVDGIGTICHEFSHCLGLPDMYDTQANQYGMGTYDLMDQGSYNGDSFQPPYYSAYEKWYCGWATPTELSEAATVKDMKPVAEGGQTFVIYNDNHKDEYYLLENRQQEGWDGSLYGKGLMITHVDFDATVWRYNLVNANYSYNDGTKTVTLNDHQRCTIFHADNEDGTRTLASIAGDLYPYTDSLGNVNNGLSASTLPSDTLYNANAAGTHQMDKPVTNIVQNADGTISFDFMGGSATNVIDGIEALNVRRTADDEAVYNLMGMRMPVSNVQNGQLPAGVYIRGGKKFVVK